MSRIRQDMRPFVRDKLGAIMVNDPLTSPYFREGVGIEGVPLDSHDSTKQ